MPGDQIEFFASVDSTEKVESRGGMLSTIEAHHSRWEHLTFVLGKTPIHRPWVRVENRVEVAAAEEGAVLPFLSKSLGKTTHGLEKAKVVQSARKEFRSSILTSLLAFGISIYLFILPGERRLKSLSCLAFGLYIPT